MDKILFEMGANTQAVYDATNKLVDNIRDYIKGLLGKDKGKWLRIKEPQDVASTDPIKWLYINENGKVTYRTTELLDYDLDFDGLTANEATELANDLVSGHYVFDKPQD